MIKLDFEPSIPNYKYNVKLQTLFLHGKKFTCFK